MKWLEIVRIAVAALSGALAGVGVQPGSVTEVHGALAALLPFVS